MPADKQAGRAAGHHVHLGLADFCSHALQRGLLLPDLDSHAGCAACIPPVSAMTGTLGMPGNDDPLADGLCPTADTCYPDPPCWASQMGAASLTHLECQWLPCNHHSLPMICMTSRVTAQQAVQHGALLLMPCSGMHDKARCTRYGRRTALGFHLRQQAGRGGLDAVKGELYFVPLPAAHQGSCQETSTCRIIQFVAYCLTACRSALAAQLEQDTAGPPAGHARAPGWCPGQCHNPPVVRAMLRRQSASCHDGTRPGTALSSLGAKLGSLLCLRQLVAGCLQVLLHLLSLLLLRPAPLLTLGIAAATMKPLQQVSAIIAAI